MQLASSLRRMRAPHWLGFYTLIALAWGALYAMQLPPDLVAAANLYGAEFWQALCRIEPGLAGAPNIFLMWAVMSAAMMAPTALPALATWDDLVQTGRGAGFGALLSGYLAVWLGFAALATVAQLALAGAGLLNPLGASVNTWLTALLLAGAGAYQFSTLKDSCLAKCRRPLTFFIQYWEDGPLRMGLRLGAVCLGCCWALMMLEKLPAIGAVLTRPLGYGLMALSGAVVIFELGGWT